MNDQKEIEKIKKLTEKKKTALGKIGDEDSFNMITHYLEHEDAKVRVAACKAALVIDTEYMKTRVRHQLMVETDPEAKKQMQEAMNSSKETRV